MLNAILTSTVLFIGDSHSVGPFGWFLDENLRKSGWKVATYASCGSIAKWWQTGQRTTCGFYAKDLDGQVSRANSAPTPKFTDLLREVRPDSVIVALGANYVKTPSDDFVKSDLAVMAQQIKEASADCYWILPPDMRLYRSELPRLKRLVKETVSLDCKIFESEAVTSYPASGGDGVHYWFKEGEPIARKWADAVFADFTSLHVLDHP